MAATDIFLGRGIVTLGGTDIGLCSSLRLRHEVQSVAIATWDSTPIGGVAEVARRTRVFVDITMHELSAANRALIWDLVDDPDELALVWTGHDPRSDTCADDDYVLSVPKWVLMPAADTQLMPKTFQDTDIELTGEALRDSGASTWYSFTFTPGA